MKKAEKAERLRILLAKELVLLRNLQACFSLACETYKDNKTMHQVYMEMNRSISEGISTIEQVYQETLLISPPEKNKNNQSETVSDTSRS